MQKLSEGDFVIYNKSIKNNTYEKCLAKIIEINNLNFTVEVVSGEIIKAKTNELEDIWTNDNQLKQIGFINYGNYWKLNEIIIFRPKYDLYTNNDIKKIIFGNQLFIANHNINNNYFDTYKKANIFDLKAFLNSHTEVTLLLQLFNFLDIQKIKYHKEEIASLVKLRN